MSQKVYYNPPAKAKMAVLLLLVGLAAYIKHQPVSEKKDIYWQGFNKVPASIGLPKMQQANLPGNRTSYNPLKP